MRLAENLRLRYNSIKMNISAIMQRTDIVIRAALSKNISGPFHWLNELSDMIERNVHVPIHRRGEEFIDQPITDHHLTGGAELRE